MATITYVPQSADDNQSVQWGGKTFKAGEAVEVDDPKMLLKADRNSYFKVEGATEELEKAEEREIVGGYADANTGQPVELVRSPRSFSYSSVPAAVGPTPPSTPTQGSSAVDSMRPPIGPNTAEFERLYGAKPEELGNKEDVDAKPIEEEAVLGTKSERKVENKSEEFKPAGDTKPTAKGKQSGPKAAVAGPTPHKSVKEEGGKYGK